MKNLLIVCLLTVSLFANEQIPAPPQKNPIILKNGFIHTISNGVIEGSILFNKGKIIRIAKYITPPKDCEVIDLKGKHVYPGMIAAVSGLGLVEINAVAVTNDHSERGDFNPNVRTNVAFNPDSEIIPTTRSNGILIANVIPASGLVSGQSSVMMLDGWTWENATLSFPSGLHINWPNMNSGARTDNDKKRLKAAKQQLDDLEKMIKDARAYARLRKTKSRLAENYHNEDLRWESMIPYVEKKRPIFVHANEVRQIEASISWANRHNLEIVIVGGKDAWRTTDLLVKNRIPVIYEGVTSLPFRRFEDYDQAYKTPSILYEKGVQFCISDYGYAGKAEQIRNLPYQASMAASYGLPKEAAFRAVTLSVAEILGIDKKVGSLDEGKDATLFISDGDPLETRTNIIQAFIEGKKIDMGDRHKSLYSKYKEKYRQLDILKE
jgi:imidazolonepropionase-like amidohydrolase